MINEYDVSVSTQQLRSDHHGKVSYFLGGVVQLEDPSRSRLHAALVVQSVARRELIPFRR